MAHAKRSTVELDKYNTIHPTSRGKVSQVTPLTVNTPMLPSYEIRLRVGRGGSLVDSSPFVRRVVGSNPALE